MSHERLCSGMQGNGGCISIQSSSATLAGGRDLARGILALKATTWICTSHWSEQVERPCLTSMGDIKGIPPRIQKTESWNLVKSTNDH